MSIASQHISVVLQGPVRDETRKLIVSVRRLLPKAELILSTWPEENTDDLGCDIVVKSAVPPAYIQHERQGVRNNLNRLIRSSQAGIKAAGRQYILKMRSDMALESLRFLDIFENYPNRTNMTVLRHKVLLASLFSRIAYRGHNTPFHLSDWFAFGLKEDIESIFLPLREVEEPRFTQWFTKGERAPFGSTTLRMAPEQYIFYSFYRRHFCAAEMDDCRDNSVSICNEANKFTVSNFVIAEYKQSGIYLPKYSSSINEQMIGMEFFDLWNIFTYEKYYKEFCDECFEFTDSSEVELYKNRLVYAASMRLTKHLNALRNSKSFTKGLEELITIPIIFISYIFAILFRKIRKQ